jgi:putative flippase GtrA
MKGLLRRLGVTDKKTLRALLGQLFKFGCVGLLNAALSVLIYNAVLYFNPSLYLAGNALAWVVTVAVSYLLNRRFTFKGTREAFFRGLVKCYLAYLAGLAVSTLLLLFWVEAAGIPEQPAQLINIVVMIPANFLVSKFFTFARREKE